MDEKQKFGFENCIFIWSTYQTKIIFDRGKLFLECYYKKENLTFQYNKEFHNGSTKMQKYCRQY